MEARFRIRTHAGQDLEPRTLEIFSEMVRSGVIRSEDLVFDALTRDWVPAGVHPMVRLFRDPLVDDPAGVAQGHAPGQASGADALGLALTEPTVPSPEEEAAAFIRKMEEERRSDPLRAPLSLELPLDPGTAASRSPLRTPEPAEILLDPAPPAGAPERQARRRWGGWWGLLGAAAIGAGLGVLPLGPRQSRPEEAPAATLVRSDRPPGLEVHDVDPGLRAAARSAYLARVRAVRDEAAPAEVPAVWLEGRYLAAAVAHPEVRGYWEGVLAFAQEARSREGALYREAWLESADRFGLVGPVRSLRLATALGDFGIGAPEREEHYRRVEQLATAALKLHDLLVELGDRVTYEPQRGRRVSADPVLEAAGADPAAQALLEVALDRVLSALRGPDGSLLRDRARLAAWIVEVP
jgi:hypothetical protein